MKYDIFATDYSSETRIDNETYSVDITLGIHPTDDIAPNFSKTITVISNNNMNGYQVDEQRSAAINEFMSKINL